jgi:hypothetical protein
MRTRVWLRAGLLFLTLVQTSVGLGMVLLPRSFFNDVPTVAAYPPFNEHLMRDLGSLYLAIAVVVGVSAVVMERRLVYTALSAYIVMAVPHLVFHATHTEGMQPGDAVALTSSLTVLVIVPATLLTLTRELPDDAPPT